MTNWLSKLFFLVVGLAVVGGLAFAFMPEPVDVDMATIGRGSLLVTVDEDGKTRIREKYVVSTPLSGRLLRIDLDPGDSVTADQTVLAVVEPRDPELLDARAIAQAEAREQAAAASLKRVEPVLEQARLRQAQAERDLERYRKLLDSKGVTREEFEKIETSYRAASEELRASRYSQEIAEFELEQAKAALLRTRPSDNPEADDASDNGWNFAIRSPIDGRVLRVFQESAAVVTAGASLLELGDPTDLEVEIDVLSSDAVRIEPGARVLLEHWGGESPLEGRVRLVEPAGFTKISTLGVEEQRVNVIVDLVDPPAARQQLGDGFRVEARIVTASAGDALIVPTSALFRSAGEWVVFKIEEGRARQTRVSVGKQNDLQAEVLEGLAESDRVILHPSDRVRDGSEVRSRTGG
ncbi:putative efflux system component YknX [Posidoniimonas polymericola]|uniref:Putative efflux system component YknX n=1 Tax=Posidoniimonas polymericola TaxID=2528002 RepID=A0A5C5ZE56_9BACT|nr:HlyD family efflux transporter periplasmic adaptor subunit [Posidoniimonas polymericola]TWT85440.1 putative efflux system component YknX [Posidoniimonas polymericola]